MSLKPTDISDLEHERFAERKKMIRGYRSTGARVRDEWRWQGQLHSVNDHPAVIVDDGDEMMWYTHGLRHRDRGPAWIKRREGIETWYHNDLVHRTDGPAMIMPDREKWYQYGECSRTDGPAVIYTDQNRWEWWYLGERHISLEQWAWCAGVDDELFVMLKLEYGC